MYNLGQSISFVLSKFSRNTALISSENQLSYFGLNELAERINTVFIENNIAQGDVVAIVNTKEFSSYAMMVACLLSGVTYVNLDIDNPEERVSRILEKCKPVAIFSDIETEKFRQIAGSIDVTYLTEYAIKDSKQTPFNELNVDGSTIAYIMFTSGSTGAPKGAAITHQNLIHFINWTSSRYNVTPNDNFANVSPMYFDNSVFDFYTALFNGATLTPIKKHITSDPLKLTSYVDEMKCTIWFSVPSLLIFLSNMKVLTKEVFKNIRIFTFGGEGFPKSELQKVYALYKDRATFINVYGPTECTCICSSYTISDNDFNDLSELPSLGEINPNFSFTILDVDNNESVEGELCLIGPNVGVGYYNDKERSDQSFLTCNDKKNYLKPMYKTGDLVSLRGKELFFKGRVDNQVKHMGYRIELEEIEIAINSVPNVNQVGVIYKRVKESYGKIIAYISTKSTELDSRLIKTKLSEKLPSYMIPNSIVILSELPKNQNGKIDRKQLAKL